MTTARGKKAFWITVAVALIPTIGMTVFAWRMVANVRADAAVTDARLRELAWACLAYADRFGGFPNAESELRAFAVPSELRTPDGRFPSARAAATQASPAPTLDECLESIEVEWPTVRDVQPILRPKGKPTLQGTAPTVGQWLYAMAERVRGG